MPPRTNASRPIPLDPLDLIETHIPWGRLVADLVVLYNNFGTGDSTAKWPGSRC